MDVHRATAGGMQLAVDEQVLVTRSPEGVDLYERCDGEWRATSISAHGRWPAWNPTADLIAIRSTNSAGGASGAGAGEAVDLVGLDGVVIASAHRRQPVRAGGNAGNSAESGTTAGQAGRGSPAVEVPLCWSPGGNILSYVSPGLHGDTLFLSDVGGLSTADPIIRGVPLYIAWCTDDNFLAVHAAAELVVVETEGSRVAADVAPHCLGFHAPAYSDDAEILAYGAAQEGGVALMRALFQGTGSRRAHLYEGARLCLGFRPGSQELAVAVAASGDDRAPFKELWLHDLAVEGQLPRRLDAERFAGFWWSPTGTRLAMLKAVDRERYVIEVRTAEGLPFSQSWPFVPSADYLAAAAFCDQVGLAHWFWSADGASFLICGQISGEPDGAAAAEDAVFRWRPGADTTLDRVGEGSFATFRPPRLKLHG